MIISVGKGFDFSRPIGEAYVYDWTKVVFANGSVSLRKDALTGRYPTTSVVVRTPMFSPTAVRAWRGIRVVRTEPTDGFGTTLATVAYRLSTGATDYVWSGAAWAATTTLWNTHAELQEGFPSFPVTAHKVQVVFRLLTTNWRYTPSVDGCGIIYDADITSFEEIAFLRTLRPALEQITIEADVGLLWPADGLTADVKTIALNGDAPVTVSDVDRAFDLDADPDQAVNVCSSYVPGTGTLTATHSIDAGTRVLVRALIHPIAVYATHPDYVELPSLPAIAIGPIRAVEGIRSPVRGEVANETTEKVLFLASPRQVSYDVSLRVIANRVLDQFRLVGAMQTFFAQNPVLSFSELDGRLSVLPKEDEAHSPTQDATHIQRADMTVRMYWLSQWLLPVEEGDAAATPDFDVHPAG